MSISINNHHYTPKHTNSTKSGKTTEEFAIPGMEDVSVTDQADAPVNDDKKMDDYEAIQDYLRSKAQILPCNIGLRGEEAEKFLEGMMAPILYEFTENGPTRIKEGLSPENQLIAEKYLAAMQPFKPGLGYEFEKEIIDAGWEALAHTLER